MRKLVAGLVLALMSGCDGGVTGPPVPLTGLWASNSGGVSVVANLVEAGTSVTGTGSVDALGLSTTFTAAGSHIGQSVVLTLTAPVYGTFLFSGTQSGSTITGVITSASYPDLPVSLTKQ